MEITTAKWHINQKTNEKIGIWVVTPDENMGVPIDPANRHYAEIMRQVDAGELTIEEAE